MTDLQTIAAIATPQGRGGVAVIRVSGSLALEAAKELTGLNPKPRHAYYTRFIKDGVQLDEGILLYFPAPHSYTGEDVTEFQGHAGTVAPQRLLKGLLGIKGIRLAEPGEFTRRAFMNGRMDLTEAEAVEDLISAGSESAARAALASLSGAFSDDLNRLSQSLTDFRVHLEGCLDFPEEHEDFFDSGKAKARLKEILSQAELSHRRGSQGLLLSEGARLVLAGAPNAGKSSLLNALSGEEKAIVTSIPGTTRDVLSSQIVLDGVTVNITDTAGLRDNPSDEIEAIGIKKAMNEIRKADLTLLLIDGSLPPAEGEEILNKLSNCGAEPSRVLIAVSKADLHTNRETEAFLNSPKLKAYRKVHTSVKTGSGLNELKDTLRELLGIMPVEGTYSARRRQISELEEAINGIKRAGEMLDFGDLVLCAQEIREAQDHLGTITGKVTSDDILGRIFSTFCIGK